MLSAGRGLDGAGAYHTVSPTLHQFVGCHRDSLQLHAQGSFPMELVWNTVVVVACVPFEELHINEQWRSSGYSCRNLE